MNRINYVEGNIFNSSANWKEVKEILENVALIEKGLTELVSYVNLNKDINSMAQDLVILLGKKSRKF